MDDVPSVGILGARLANAAKMTAAEPGAGRA